MPSPTSHLCTRSLLFGVFTLLLLSILPVAAHADPTVTLVITNPKNTAGDIVAPFCEKCFYLLDIAVLGCIV